MAENSLHWQWLQYNNNRNDNGSTNISFRFNLLAVG